MASTDARPVPKKNVAYRHYFAIRDSAGALVTTWAGQDSELSADGGNYADATNEATEIETSGTGYIDLTAGEMNYDCVLLKVTVTNTDALPYIVALFPEEAGDIRTDVTELGGDAQSVADLKDFADAGYDPATNKVQGVVLVDTTTTNSDMRGTDSALTATTTIDGTENVTEVLTTVRAAVAGVTTSPGANQLEHKKADGITTDYTETVNLTDGTRAIS